MSTTRKLTLSILILLGLSLIAIISLHMLSKKNEQEFMEYSREQVREAASSIADLYEVQMYWIAYDYTLWDAMVKYIEEPDSAWANENFEQFLYWFELDAFWILNKEGQVLLTDTTGCASAMPLTEFNDELLAKLHKERMLDYYTTANDTLMLLQGATIHPTIDEERKAEPAGYFFIAKCWDEGIIGLAESLTGSDVTQVINRPGLNKPSETDYKRLAIPYKDMDDHTIAWLVFSKRIDFIELLRKNSLNILLMITLTVLITYVVLSLAIKKWVTSPLILIKKTIAHNDTGPIPKLKLASTDFEQIGNLIESFILQKEELQYQKERAEESDRLKSAFLANMSHEIRTPMNGILGFAELLKEPHLSVEQQQKYIQIIEKSGERMLNIINDIVDISRIEAGVMEVMLSESNVNEQLEYIYTFFKPEVEAKGMQLLLSDLLPTEKAIVVTDREKLFAVLTNLIKNAIKYSKKGFIEYGCRGKGSMLEFFVKDTGIGIPKDRQQAIFDRFVQADIEDKEAMQGAGLGLAITKAYLEMLGGEIWVESEEGKGSTFYFTIPCKKEHPESGIQVN